jgi:hypothetical protein
MRRRLYFLLPDLGQARATLDELLLARIEIKHIHFLAREGTLPDDMPELAQLQKTDVVHGAQLGLLIGGVIGLVAGIALTLFPLDGLSLRAATIVLLTLCGALFGGWASGMNAAAVPNTHLERFGAAIEQGQVLLILDVPASRVYEIEQLFASRHPDFRFGGIEPPALAFP